MKLKNITSAEAINWRNVEFLIYDVMKLHDFEQIRLSLLQDGELLKNCLQRDFFSHKDGKDPNNIVIDLSLNENISLRPEGTISLLTNFLDDYDISKVLKYYYLGNMIRVKDNEIEETYRLGAEIYGDATIVSDITVIDTALKLLNALGFKTTMVEINSYGCEKCTLNLPQAMKNKWQGNSKEQKSTSKLPANYYQDSLSNSDYCDSCQDRLHKIRHFLYQT